MSQYQQSLMIFRRDLRVNDNTALLNAVQLSKSVIPCFIFDPRQIDAHKNSFYSHNAVQFMVESLKDLEQQLHKTGAKLYLFHGIAHQVVEALIEKHAVDAVFVNRDYTPFSITRDEEIEHVCGKHRVTLHAYHDLLLHEPEIIKKTDGTPYTVFTPFWKASVAKGNVAYPESLPPQTNWYTKAIPQVVSHDMYKKLVPHPSKGLATHGGRKQALSILQHIDSWRDYISSRDVPALPTTTLSAHLKFGTISIREAYHVISEILGIHHPLIRQLYWRDFYCYVAYHSPFVYGQSFRAKYDNVPWRYDTQVFERWCNGTTGFPIVDAGMRQLNATGWMHNRVRMIVASFLTKDLHIDWRWGEKYFAQHLIDYDPAVNNGNWQWSASTGCDPQPYFRIFNPWLQQKKFDPDCTYIKQWVPELRTLTPAEIHRWQASKKTLPKYPKPMVDHAKESALSKKMFKQAAYG